MPLVFPAFPTGTGTDLNGNAIAYVGGAVPVATGNWGAALQSYANANSITLWWTNNTQLWNVDQFKQDLQSADVGNYNFIGAQSSAPAVQPIAAELTKRYSLTEKGRQYYLQKKHTVIGPHDQVTEHDADFCRASDAFIHALR
jgi:hypothetical protein